MTRETFTTSAMAALAAVATTGATMAVAQEQAAPAQTGLVGAIQGGKLIFDLRPRYAAIEQDGFAEDASALTLRTKLGWETAAFRGFKGLVEFEDVRALVEDFNSIANGRTQFPVEADPEVTELNRIQLGWTGSNGLSAIAGRQAVVFDDQRFVGDVAWRQDQQTLDAARLDFAKGSFTLSYAYVWGVERVFAEEQDWGSDSHLLNASFKLSDAFKATGFVYALDFDEAAALSTVTTGAAVSGTIPLDAFKLAYDAVLATQSDYGDNPGSLDLGYARGGLGFGYGPFTVSGSYELLEGDGVRGFSTPLATLHAFQGWADVFLTTPAAGIEDVNFTARYAPSWTAGPVSTPVFMVRWHEFEADQTGADLGSEIDAQLTARLAPKVTGILKIADYDGPTGGPADRTKVWVGLQFTL
jgi:hypothetical protein